MKISPINQNYSFRAYHKNNIEKSPYSRTGDLTHTSHFFRWDSVYKTNEIIGELLKKNNHQPINIVSMGCSYGEEVYSLAMTMDYFGIKSNIVGFDISSEAVNGAKDGKYSLSGYEGRYLIPNYPGLFNFDKTTAFQEQMRKDFAKKFTQLDAEKRIFQKKSEQFKNCSFFKGDVTKLKNYFNDNSQDFISCSYVLYHLTEKEQFDTIIQIYNALKPGGLLCISPLEEGWQNDLLYMGFVQPNRKYPWILQKPIKNLSSKLNTKNI